MPNSIDRRTFLSWSAVFPLALAAPTSMFGAATTIPVGLELYSVRDSLAKDLEGTVRAVAQMGYQCVEFYAPYFDWTETRAKQVRKLLDELGIRCYSTHNARAFLAPDKVARARDLNAILGSRYVVLASAGDTNTSDAWKAVADLLNAASDQLSTAGQKTGYHNHVAEFRGAIGQRPMDILAKNTNADVMLQLDVGTCIEAGSDPAEWIRANPGRIRSIHCKDWSPEPGKGYQVMFGEGVADWKGIFKAGKGSGGVEFYLVEQEGSRFPELETAKKCLETFRSKHG